MVREQVARMCSVHLLMSLNNLMGLKILLKFFLLVTVPVTPVPLV